MPPRPRTSGRPPAPVPGRPVRPPGPIVPGPPTPGPVRRMGGGVGRLSACSTRMTCGPERRVFSRGPSCGPTGPTTLGRDGTFMIGAASAALPNDAGGGGGAVMTRRGAAVPAALPSPDGVGVRAPAAAPPSEGRVAERPAAYGRGATGDAPAVPLEPTGDVAGAAPVAEGAVGEGAAGGVPI